MLLSFLYNHSIHLYFILTGERAGAFTRENNPPATSHFNTYFIALCCIEYTSPSAEFEPTTLVVIYTDCIDSGKSNCHNDHRHHHKFIKYEKQLRKEGKNMFGLPIKQNICKFSASLLLKS
jgi:hypothetical protein